LKRKALRKMLGDKNSPTVAQLKSLIATQSQKTIGRWVVGFAIDRILPIWQSQMPDDCRASDLLAEAKSCVEGEIKLAALMDAKRASGPVAREVSSNPIALACARAIFDLAVQSVHKPTGSIGFAWYAAAAIAYAGLGASAEEEEYDLAAEEVLRDYLAALRSVAIEGEPNPVKVDWDCD